MRISDWSSDVCSADLQLHFQLLHLLEALDEAGAGGVALEVGDVVGLAAEPLRGHEAVQLVARFLQLLDHHRSEEHTSELQSLMRISYAVFCLKKKNINYTNYNMYSYNYTNIIDSIPTQITHINTINTTQHE